MGLNVTLDGRFVLKKKAGSGGMSTVYLAWDEKEQSEVAVKLLRKSAKAQTARFNREVELMAELSHPNIVRYVASGETPGQAPYLAVEWVEGQPLLERLSDPGLTTAEAIDAGRVLASALGFAHARGIVHRDVTPNNILFTTGGELKLIDFGIAHLGGEEAGLTRTGTVLGTFGYMSPEQARGLRVDARSDIFSLGCILYLCLTGRNAFAGENLVAVQTKILYHWPSPLAVVAPDLPRELTDLVQQMLAKDPGARPSDGSEVAERLASIAAGVPAGGERARLSGQQAGDVPETSPIEATVAPAGATVEAHRQGETCSLIIAEPAPSPEGAAANTEELRAALSPLADRFKAEFYVLSRGSVAVALRERSREACARRTAQCAIALRSELPRARILLSIGRESSGGQGVPERLIDSLARTQMANTVVALRGGASPEGAIELDADAAELLGDEFEIRRCDGAAYLCPRGDAGVG